jgi:hypothetical protein
MWSPRSCDGLMSGTIPKFLSLSRCIVLEIYSADRGGGHSIVTAPSSPPSQFVRFELAPVVLRHLAPRRSNAAVLPANRLSPRTW